MRTVQRIAKNTVTLITANITNKLLGFLFTMYIARYLGARGFGILSFATAFTGLFTIFTDFGLNKLMIREVSREKSLAGTYLGNISMIKVLLSAITFGLTAVTINLLRYPAQTVSVVYLIAFSGLLLAFANMFNSLFRAFERMEYEAIGGVLRGGLLLLGALWGIHEGFTVIGFALLYVIANLIAVGFDLAIAVRKFMLPRLKIDIEFWKRILREAWPLGLAGLFITLYYYIDSVMLSKMKGNEVVGWYNAAYRLVLALGFIPGSFLGAVFPNMSRFFKSSEYSLKRASEKAFKYLLIIAVPIGVGTTLLASRIILLIYGNGYTPSVLALQILIWSEVMIFLNMVLANLIIAIDQQGILTKQAAGAAALNVILNLILIPRYSYIGASIATVSTEAFAFIFLYTWLSRSRYQLSHKTLLTDMAKVLLAVVLVGVFIKYCNGLNLAALINAGGIAYFILVMWFKIITKDDIQLFKQLFAGSKT